MLIKKYLPFFLLLTLLFSFSCKKPKSEKNVVQQTIQTPPLQLAEQPTTPPADLIEKSVTELAPAPTETPTLQIVPASTSIVKSSINLEIIIDASGSMNGFIGQTTKIDAVKKVLKEIMSTPLPLEITNRKISLRTFGNKFPSETNNCTDTAVTLKMDKYNSETFGTALDQITPQGVTPLAFTLEDANNDFTEPIEKADNLIVLVTDGWETCNGNPMAAVERLQRNPSKVIVDVVGLDVDQKAADSLKDLAKTGSGQFFLARSEVELSAALDQAISSNLPYNLRVKAVSGASPLSSIVTIYRANTQAVVERTEVSGLKFFKLQPGTYDIMVEYRASVEAIKPSKIIKGVEVTATTKAEQMVQFDLGNLNLTALDQNGKETNANFYIRKAGSEELWGRLQSAQSPFLVHLTPGTYEIDAETADPNVPTLTAHAKDVEVKLGETVEQTLKFETGKLALKAQNVSKQLIPISYRIAKPNAVETFASGEGLADGTIVDLPPGNYDVYVTWHDPKIQGSPEAKLSNITLNGGETLEQLVTIITGTIKLSGKDSQGKLVHTEFSFKKAGTDEEVAKAVSEEGVIEAFAAPGTYDIIATNTTSKIIPAPSVVWNGITIKEGQSQTLEAIFKLGTLKLIGKNAKEQIIPASFTVYRSGTDEPLVVENSERDWVTFNLTPTLYDIKAEDLNAKSDPKPAIWFHDIEIMEGKTITNEAIFTSGKLKLICRGKNNVVLTCEFNVFSYGSDTALFSGTTADEWREFDIPPGKYYMETGWHDPVEEQLLKKWINLTINQNQIVEEILRF